MDVDDHPTDAEAAHDPHKRYEHPGGQPLRQRDCPSARRTSNAILHQVIHAALIHQITHLRVSAFINTTFSHLLTFKTDGNPFIHTNLNTLVCKMRYVCACVCICLCVFVRVCVCICVWHYHYTTVGL
jgi:hypothetical protein